MLLYKRKVSLIPWDIEKENDYILKTTQDPLKLILYTLLKLTLTLRKTENV